MKHLLTIAVLAAALVALPAHAQMKPPVPMTPAQFSNAVAGQSVILAVRVSSRSRDDVRAELLTRIDDAHYRATGTSIALYFPADTPIVMGSESDVKPAAVLFVYGVATTRGRADVKKATVITSYVTIQ